MNILAVVVTYNRKKLLLECLDAIFSQTLPCDSIIVIDNASTDGTKQALQENGYMERIDYRLMSSNLGGAGGFHEGLKEALEYNADWIWIMDDDTIVKPDSLEKLIDKTITFPNASFFASCVAGPNGEPMNVTSVDTTSSSNGYSDWYFQLDDKLVKIQAATFVSILINYHAIQTCGLPCKDFFLWCDDTEYTMRLTKYFGPAYLVGDSWVCHKRNNATVLNIEEEYGKQRIMQYYYLYRNELVVKALYSAPGRWILLFAKEQVFVFKLLFSGKEGIYRASIVEKGLFGFIFHYRRFRKQIELEIRNEI